MMRIGPPVLLRSLLAALALGVAGCAGPGISPGASASAPPSSAALAFRAVSFEAELFRARQFLEPALAELPEAPVPRDPGGGYTHERHKANYRIIRTAGALYELTGEKRYARLARDLLLSYADLYPTLGPHPVKASRTPGRLFWQSLNDAVWAVEASQGYVDIKDTLTPQERARIEGQVLRPMAAFLSQGQPEVFNLIHNHGTWAVAGVGMIGYALEDEDLVRQALYGLDGSGRAGYLRQIDLLFSPDGYYAEGPYYQRYAIMPFIQFAREIDRREPERRIFERRDGVLLKAAGALLQMSEGGKLFPINDAIPEKGLDSPEIVTAVAVAYERTRDPQWLGAAIEQGRLLLDPIGREMGAAIARGEAAPPARPSLLLRDGPAGENGALAILRDPRQRQTLVFEATSQGLNHGHFDRLAWLFYDGGALIVQDYGAARFLNVEEKRGGRYLPENETWAKQTIAHHTLVIDETSHFDGDLDRGEASAPRLLRFDERFAAAEAGAVHPGVSYRRAVALLPLAGGSLVVDFIEADAAAPHAYDLPVPYAGQLIEASVSLRNAPELRPLGPANGYQHLWRKAEASLRPGEPLRIGWFANERFFRYHAVSDNLAEVVLAELGAADPEYNLRPYRSFILRGRGARGFSMAAVLEAHGRYSSAEEFVEEGKGRVQSIARYENENGAALVLIKTNDGTIGYGVSWDSDETASHAVSADGREWRWRGFHGVATADAQEGAP